MGNYKYFLVTIRNPMAAPLLLVHQRLQTTKRKVKSPGEVVLSTWHQALESSHSLSGKVVSHTVEKHQFTGLIKTHSQLH